MVAAPKVDNMQPANEAEEVIVDSDTLSWSEMSIGRECKMWRVIPSNLSAMARNLSN